MGARIQGDREPPTLLSVNFDVGVGVRQDGSYDRLRRKKYRVRPSSSSGPPVYSLRSVFGLTVHAPRRGTTQNTTRNMASD